PPSNVHIKLVFETMAHFGLREYGVLRCERDVGEKRQPRARAHGPAVDRANDWFAELPHAAEVARIDAPRVDDLGGGLSGDNAVGPLDIPTAAHAISLVHSRGKGASRASE